MRIRTKSLLLVCGIGALRCAAAGVEADPADFLYAIRLVESGDRYDCPRGKAGEIGAYQFRPAVWRQYTSVPISQATTAYADKIAALHYRAIANRLQSGGMPATDWNIAVAWNSGVDAVISGRIPSSTRDYATRVVNLVKREADLRRSLTPVFHVGVN